VGGLSPGLQSGGGGDGADAMWMGRKRQITRISFLCLFGTDQERGPPSLVNTIRELLGRKSSGSSIGIRKLGRIDPSC
jgi:hypothetical protein